MKTRKQIETRIRYYERRVKRGSCDKYGVYCREECDYCLQQIDALEWVLDK